VSLVALGDSVPYGTNCDCTPYPELPHGVGATNDAVPGYTTEGVLRDLEGNTAIMDHVRAADIVEIEVGANDAAYTSACGAEVSCYAPGVAQAERNLPAIVARVNELDAGRVHHVVLLDYWSVWLGGQYAAAHGDAYVAAAKQVTEEIDAAIRSTAEATHSTYVDLRAAFKGPNYAYDETHYLSDDGDHPNAAGHQQIAAAVEAAVAR
jgi:lysophospholipase L1-like esterase